MAFLWTTIHVFEIEYSSGTSFFDGGVFVAIGKIICIEFNLKECVVTIGYMIKVYIRKWVYVVVYEIGGDPYVVNSTRGFLVTPCERELVG